MGLKEHKEGYAGKYEGREGKGKYIKISKLKEVILKGELFFLIIYFQIEFVV